MDAVTTVAARLYHDARSVAAPEPDRRAPDPVALGESFASVLSRGEELAKAAMTGRADAHSLVEALAATELAVETAVTIRDKVVEAYQEILRMPV
ncbi:MAG: flagellar hook-basal body complex protein FliE [Gemmobacter sp.]